MAEGMTVEEAARAMVPPIPRRELARRLKDVAPIGTVYGRRGRRPRTFPVDAIFAAHAAWVSEQARTAGASGPGDVGAG